CNRTERFIRHGRTTADEASAGTRGGARAPHFQLHRSGLSHEDYRIVHDHSIPAEFYSLASRLCSSRSAVSTIRQIRTRAVPIKQRAANPTNLSASLSAYGSERAKERASGHNRQHHQEVRRLNWVINLSSS